jgi:hypothetical protein
MALSIAARGYVVQTGRIVLHDTTQNLVNAWGQQHPIHSGPGCSLPTYAYPPLIRAARAESSLAGMRGVFRPV